MEDLDLANDVFQSQVPAAPFVSAAAAGIQTGDSVPRRSVIQGEW